MLATVCTVCRRSSSWRGCLISNLHSSPLASRSSPTLDLKLFRSTAGTAIHALRVRRLIIRGSIFGNKRRPTRKDDFFRPAKASSDLAMGQRHRSASAMAGPTMDQVTALEPPQLTNRCQFGDIPCAMRQWTPIWDYTAAWSLIRKSLRAGVEMMTEILGQSTYLISKPQHKNPRLGREEISLSLVQVCGLDQNLSVRVPVRRPALPDTSG
jgi:hypothetical protein